MACSTPGFPVLHCPLEFAQTHVYWLGDAIQPSHPLSSPSLPAFNLSQYQGLFKWVSSLNQLAIVLELQHQFFQWIFRVDFLQDWLVWYPCCSRDSQESSPAPQFESINSLTLSLLYGPTLISVHDYRKTIGLTIDHALIIYEDEATNKETISEAISAILVRNGSDLNQSGSSRLTVYGIYF